MDKIKGKLHVSPFLLVMISFIVVILVGSFLIVTPIAQTSGKWGNYVDALFTATSATCVTGLVTYKDGIIGSLTFFGQLIVLICIQIGGLGFFTILAFVITLFKRKLEFKDRYILSQAVGSESMFALSKFVRKIILISFSFELIGALLSLPVFFQVYDKIGDVIWASIFHSISSYNNAGFDIIGTTSLVVSPSNPILETMPQWAYIYLNIVIMFLIVAGGISFIVVIEIFSFKKRAKRWSVFTKIVLFMTTILIFGGAGIFMLTDGLKQENPMNFLQALFQSVTLRTAGFANYNQADISTAGKVVSCLLMFTGAAPLSTGGGIKVTTAFLIIVAMYSYLRGRKVVAFKRLFGQKTVLKGLSLMILAFGVVIISFVLTSSIEGFNSEFIEQKFDSFDLLYESFSAFGTVGVSTGVTPYLSWGSKIILSIVMYIGRLGPITFFQIFHVNINDVEEKSFSYVEEDFLIG